MGDRLERGDEVRALPGGPEGPSDLPGGPDQRVDQHAGAVANVLRLASFTFAGLGRFGRGGALEHWHASFFIATDHHAALLISPQRLDVELADGVGCRRERLGVALEPLLTLVRLQLDLL